MNTLAIDFGTTNTVICVQYPVNKTPKTLQFDQISRSFKTAGSQVYVVPTLLFVQGQQLMFGEMVRQRLGLAQPERLFQAFKRDLAAEYQPPPRQIDGNTYTVEFVCGLFLQKIWEMAQQQVQPSKVIFTVPVGAFERYLVWFQDLASKLNIPEVQLVDESTAAALGYAVQSPGSVVLVVDFGGGTLDLSLVRTVAVTGQKVVRAEVIAKAEAYVGGVDIDSWIVERYLAQIGTSRAEIGEISWLNLLQIGEKLKIKLSVAAEARDSWFDEENLISHELYLSREGLEEILESRLVLEQLRQAVDEVLVMALGKGISKSEIEQVLLVGGGCQILAVQQLLISYFGRHRVKLDKPFEAVAHGALALGQQFEVQDYLQHSYAIRLWEPDTKAYSYFSVFDKGSKYPCQRQPLILQVANEGQQEIRLDIGEVAEVRQAEVIYDRQGRMTSSLHQQEQFRSLEGYKQLTCVAHLEPPGKTGLDRIEVLFEVNEQRLLLATVKDLLTQQVLIQGAIVKLN